MIQILLLNRSQRVCPSACDDQQENQGHRKRTTIFRKSVDEGCFNPTCIEKSVDPIRDGRFCHREVFRGGKRDEKNIHSLRTRGKDLGK